MAAALGQTREDNSGGNVLGKAHRPASRRKRAQTAEEFDRARRAGGVLLVIVLPLAPRTEESMHDMGVCADLRESVAEVRHEPEAARTARGKAWS